LQQINVRVSANETNSYLQDNFTVSAAELLNFSKEDQHLLVQLNVVEGIKLEILRWLGHLFRMHELDLCRELTLLKPEGI
jgi:hypothetical protein